MPRKGYEIQRNFYYYYWILLEHFVNVLTILHEFPWAYIDGERIVNFYSILLARIYIFYNTLEILSRATSFYSWLILINAMRRKEYENTDDGERNFYSIFYINLYFAKRFENFYFKRSYAFFFFRIFVWQKGSEQILTKANFVEGLFHLETGSCSALHLYRVFHLAIYPAVLLLPTERRLFLIDFSSFSNSLRSPTRFFLPRYIAAGIVQRARSCRFFL